VTRDGETNSPPGNNVVCLKKFSLQKLSDVKRRLRIPVLFKFVTKNISKNSDSVVVNLNILLIRKDLK
jgi:hypothetical protein